MLILIIIKIKIKIKKRMVTIFHVESVTEINK